MCSGRTTTRAISNNYYLNFVTLIIRSTRQRKPYSGVDRYGQWLYGVEHKFDDG